MPQSRAISAAGPTGSVCCVPMANSVSAFIARAESARAVSDRLLTTRLGKFVRKALRRWENENEGGGLSDPQKDT